MRVYRRRVSLGSPEINWKFRINMAIDIIIKGVIGVALVRLFVWISLFVEVR